MPHCTALRDSLALYFSNHWHLLAEPSCHPISLWPFLLYFFFLLYKNPQANVFFFCSNSEENCLRKDVYRESWILHFATIQKAYAQVNICYRERFIDKPTHLDLLMLEDESVGACKFSPNTERVLRDVACSHKSFKTRFALKIILKVNPFLPPSFFPQPGSTVGITTSMCA